MATVVLSHVSKGTALTQTEFESASSHNLDGNLNLDSNLLVGNGGSTGIAISSAGEVNMAAQPAFSAYNSATDDTQTGNGAVPTVDFDTEIFDQNADFATDTFTAPVTGRYLISACVKVSGLTINVADTYEIRLVASNRSWTSPAFANADEIGTILSPSATAVIDMDASDTLSVAVTVTGEASDLAGISGASNPVTYVSGCLQA